AAITISAGNLPQLPDRLASDCCLHSHFCANGRAVGNRADAFDFDPGVAIAVVPVEKISAAGTIVCHEQIEKAVLVIVSPRTARTRIPDIIRKASFSDLRKCAVSVVVVEKVLLATGVGHEQ